MAVTAISGATADIMLWLIVNAYSSLYDHEHTV